MNDEVFAVTLYGFGTALILRKTGICRLPRPPARARNDGSSRCDVLARHAAPYSLFFVSVHPSKILSPVEGRNLRFSGVIGEGLCVYGGDAWLALSNLRFQA